MSRDTRLDEAMDALVRSLDVPRDSGIGIFAWASWRPEYVAARRAIEELFEEHAERIKLAESIILSPEAVAEIRAADAASLSVSPVPSEPRELLCQKCGRDYPVWFAQNHLWNRVADGRWHFLCLDCFALEAEALSIVPTGWALLEESELDALRAAVSPVPEPSEPQKWEWCDQCNNWWWSAHGHICGCVFVNSDIPGIGITMEPPTEPMPTKPPGEHPQVTRPRDFLPPPPDTRWVDAEAMRVPPNPPPPRHLMGPTITEQRLAFLYALEAPRDPR